MNDFLNAIGGTPTEPEILVYFKGSSEPATYTAAIMDLLKSDPDTMTICSAETGEILFTRQ